MRRDPSTIQIGQRFNHLEVIGLPVKTLKGTFFPCLCDCQTPAFIRMGLLSSTGAKTCGCERGNYKHGGRQERLYSVWSNMKARCQSETNGGYLDYGGRGISVCEDWETYDTFREWALNAGYAEGLELDRTDNDGNYEPSNCRWVTKSANLRNRRNNVLLSRDGETRTLIEWAEDGRCVVSYSTLYARIRKGMGLVQAMSTPAKSGRR